MFVVFAMGHVLISLAVAHLLSVITVSVTVPMTVVRLPLVHNFQRLLIVMASTDRADGAQNDEKKCENGQLHVWEICKLIKLGLSQVAGSSGGLVDCAFPSSPLCLFI